MFLSVKDSDKQKYKLYLRYMKELSDDPYNTNINKKDRIGLTKFSYIFPFFGKQYTEPDIPDWALNDNQIEHIVNFLDADEKLGFLGLTPSVLYTAWEYYMLPNLYYLWCTFLYGDEDNIIPDFQHFCELVNIQRNGTLAEKADVIFRICLKKGFDSNNRKLQLSQSSETFQDSSAQKSISKYVVIKYFFDLTASYLYGLGRSNNPEYLLWESCEAGLSETHLKICMKYFANSITTHKCNALDIQSLLEEYNFLRHILSSAVSMMFGQEYLLDIVPFLFSPRPTILDVSQAVFLTSLIKGKSDVSYEMVMIFNSSIDSTFHNLYELIVKEGPTLIIVEDENGHVFGGFASVSWRISSHFIGNESCFVFRLIPNIIVCKASQNNKNYMYLNLRKFGDTSPYGLGMGGDFEKFGLWIDLSSYDGYCSTTCETWKNYCCLSSTTEFSVRHLEVWRVARRNSEYKISHSVRYPAEQYTAEEVKSRTRDISRIDQVTTNYNEEDNIDK